MYDKIMWFGIFSLYTLVFIQLFRWGWVKYFPIFTAFLGQNILFTMILISLHYGSRAYFYAYCWGKAFDILTGMPSIHELCRLPAIAWSLTAYFMLELMVLSLAAPLVWHEAEQMVKPLVIGFEIIWLYTLSSLRTKVQFELKERNL